MGGGEERREVVDVAIQRDSWSQLNFNRPRLGHQFSVEHLNFKCIDARTRVLVNDVDGDLGDGNSAVAPSYNGAIPKVDLRENNRALQGTGDKHGMWGTSDGRADEEVKLRRGRWRRGRNGNQQRNAHGAAA